MAPPIKSENCADGDTNADNNKNISNNNAANLVNLRAMATGAVPKQAGGGVGSGAPSRCSLSALLIQQQQEVQQAQSQRSTELVQPLQRDTLKTLNDLLLSTVAQRAQLSNGHHEEARRTAKATSTATTSTTAASQQQQQQREALRQLAAEHTFDSADNLQEQQQRYCFPVRPVQRVQHQQQQPAAALRLRQPTTPPNATVGVVIPNITNGNEEQFQLQLPSNAISNPQSQPATGLQTLVSRLFGGATRTGSHDTHTQIEVLRSLLDLDDNWNSNAQQQKQAKIMVHEINPTAGEQDLIVNSASLEDVALSEMSDNRAQSIQSLHSAMETPTPDTTPSFDELQQRLDASNRNMQHLQDEQAKLLHIQKMATTHLNDMEQLRQQAGRLPHSAGGDPPNYESVHQVHDDMASLVGRMKNLTAFIHNQNELSNVLGDDGPEILAEQQALQEKLESLRAQREDMRNLVDELNVINSAARETAQAVRCTLTTGEAEGASGGQPIAVKPTAKPQATNERVVPVTEYRNVPIIRQEAANAAQRALHAQNMIDKKTADIDALKAQMSRLKSMLNTVSQIEESTPSVSQLLERASNGSSVERELPQYNAEIVQRVNALNDVTTELRAEAATLQEERDRISALWAEIERRKQQAAAAVQLGEDALKRSSLTPTPTPKQQQQQVEPQQKETEAVTPLHASPTRDEMRAQCESLKAQYEQKQREYDRRYKSQTQHYANTTSEADDEGNDDTDSDKYFANVRTASSATLKHAPSASTVVEQRRSNGNAKQPQEDLNVTMDNMSLGNDSIQSSSTRSQYMPPPMAPVHGIWNTHQTGNEWHEKPFFGHQATANATTGEFKVGPGPPSNASTATQAQPSSTADAMLLQQFMQTQQVLINSICQCNQSLWHQQREIDNLNNQLQTLQLRLNEPGFSLRSESVPPASLAAAGLSSISNNLCMGSTRAQSEQLYGFGTHSSAFANYPQQRQRNVNASFGYASDTQQQQHNSIFQSALNNAGATGNIVTSPSVNAQPPPQPTHFNNETPLSPSVYRASPGPIFMNHHNNTIHQNNANLRTQNQHANNLHAPPEQTAQQPTLNNQVPPGNRANNYWDNFRSYSRQNLLSINSNKSNEELELEQQLYRQMQQRQRTARSSFEHAYPHAVPQSHRGMQQQQQQQQHQQQRRHFYEPQLLETSSCSNNLNNSSSTSRDWRDEDDVEDDDNIDNIAIGGRRRNRRRVLPTWWEEDTQRNIDARQHQQQQPQNASNLLNMNVNYGNSPLYQRNKVPAKPTTSAVALTPSQQRELRFDFELPQQQQQQQQTQQNFDYVPQFSVPPPPTPPPMYNVITQELVPADESNALEQTDETASEELNRNLLVNALKNDKFTTKFYESIKEDVYRRLEILFEQQQQQQQQQHQQQMQQQSDQQLCNEAHTLRKALNRAQQDTNTQSVEELQEQQQQQLQVEAEDEEKLVVEETETTSHNAEATESGSETPLQVLQVQLENDSPEDENGTTTVEQAASMPGHEHANGNDKQSTETAAPVVENEEQIIVTLFECASPAPPLLPSSPSPHDIILTPDHELIEYIIKRIRNQTHNNTIINDSLLTEVSKLTATAAQNSAPHATTVKPLISPKRIYAKIKKMDIPRQRDDFLQWYRAYLEQLFVVEQQRSSASVAKLEQNRAVRGKKQQNERVRVQSQSQESNDADLAEADQKVSSNGAATAKSDIECENNENPEEEGGATAAAASVTAKQNASSE